jgi:hypothetical protein
MRLFHDPMPRPTLAIPPPEDADLALRRIPAGATPNASPTFERPVARSDEHGASNRQYGSIEPGEHRSDQKADDEQQPP